MVKTQPSDELRPEISESEDRQQPDSSKFSFKSLPVMMFDKIQNHSTSDEFVQVKQPSEEPSNIIQNRSKVLHQYPLGSIGEKHFLKANPFNIAAKLGVDKRLNDKDLSQDDSKHSDSEQLIPLKKIRKSGQSGNLLQDKDCSDASYDSEEENSIASKQSVSLDSNDEDDSPLEEYLKLGQQNKNIMLHHDKFSDKAESHIIQKSILMANNRKDIISQSNQALSLLEQRLQNIPEFESPAALGSNQFRTRISKDQLIGAEEQNQKINQLLSRDQQMIVEDLPQNQENHQEAQNTQREMAQQDMLGDIEKLNQPGPLQNTDSKKEKQIDYDIFDQSQINIVNKGPRRPLSPYIFFSQEKRKELKKEHPDWNSTQIMKQVSVLWQRMSAEQKRDFQEQSKKDRERYENERSDFVAKKEEDPKLELAPSVLETVKQRSQILKQQLEKRKKSDDIYIDTLLPAKRQRKVRKNSSKQLEQLVTNDQDRLKQIAHANSVKVPQKSIIHEIMPMQQQIFHNRESMDEKKETSSFTNLRLAIQQNQKINQKEEIKSSQNGHGESSPIKTKTEVQIERDRLVHRIQSDISVQKQSEQSTGRFQSRTGSSITQITQLMQRGDVSPMNDAPPRIQAFNSLQLQRQRLAQQQEYNKSSVNLSSDLHQQRFLPTPLMSSSSLQQFAFTPRNETQFQAAQLQPNQFGRGIPPSPGRNNLSSNTRLPYQTFQSLTQQQIFPNHNILSSSYQLPQQQYLGLQNQHLNHQYLQQQQYIPQEHLLNHAQLNYFLHQQQQHQQITLGASHPPSQAQIQSQQQQPPSVSQVAPQQSQVQNASPLTHPTQQQSSSAAIPTATGSGIETNNLQGFTQFIQGNPQNQSQAPIQLMQAAEFNHQIVQQSHQQHQQQQQQQQQQQLHQQQQQHQQHQQQQQSHQQQPQLQSLNSHQSQNFQNHLHGNHITTYYDDQLKAQAQANLPPINIQPSHTNLTPFQSSIQLPTIPFYGSWGYYDAKNHLRGNSNINLNEDDFNEFTNIHLQRYNSSLINNQSTLNLSFPQITNYHQGTFNLLGGPGSSSNLHIQNQPAFYPFVLQNDQAKQKVDEEQENNDQIESHNDEELLQLGKASQKQ
ncbi:UNKNOWN [Stylonychia lemnae]|uniref:HMG box domain-containing protein n=1 Tax=Stylonychia lemnae TaxID=5949 RepID=A0A077ZW19_STYLE|nr:UNKNOWN [Stylonychia lemnae]|eukprot:CDW73455.1 UNKNOWN [Stylonychia lemnae]